MAILQLGDGTISHNFDEIVRELAAFSICLKHYPLNSSLLSTALLAEAILPEAEKRELLELYDRQFSLLKQETSCLWYDLLVLHPGSPHLHTLSQANHYHTHTASETLCVLAGAAIFSFIELDGRQVQLLVQPGDFIQIPAGVEHWFSLTATLQFKAVRYFTTVDGWVPRYAASDMSNFLKKRL